MEEFSITILSSFYNQPTWLNLFLQNLDPSLLQNVILGILALLVPVGVGILSYFFEKRSKGNIEANLELYILLKTVLKADKLVIYSFLNLLLLALFNVGVYLKISSIIFTTIYFAWVFFVPFKNIWAWFLSNTTKFSSSFLRKLNIFKDAETMISSWKALWLASGKTNESGFTSIFITHIDDAIRFGKFNLAVQLAQVYVSNIEKRNRFSIDYEILPKVFEWNELLWNKQHLSLKRYRTEKITQDSFFQKHFSTFRDWVLKIYKKVDSEDEHFWNWQYFSSEFLLALIKILLKNVNGSYLFFSSFKEHIDEIENKLEKITDEEEKKKCWLYITGLFASFCPTFFDEIYSVPSNYEIWEHDFPQKWKITIANKDNRISRVILDEFLQWSRDRIFKKENEKNFDKNLTEVINGIFPNVHSSLFTSFLMLFFAGDVKYAIENQPNFYIPGPIMSWTGYAEESDEERDRRIAEMREAKDISQKKETIQIVLEFFYFVGYTKEQRKPILSKTIKEKLEKIKVEIESEKIKQICVDSQQKEMRREYILELINILILEIEK